MYGGGMGYGGSMYGGGMGMGMGMNRGYGNNQMGQQQDPNATPEQQNQFDFRREMQNTIGKHISQ